MRHLFSVLFLGALAALFMAISFDFEYPLKDAKEKKKLFCEHGRVPSTCDVCSPKTARGGTYVTQESEPKEGECANTFKKVVLASGTMEDMGFKIIEARARKISEKIRAFGETMYSPTQYARVSAIIPGIIRNVKAGIGQEVEANGVLAIIEAPELIKAKAELLQANTLLDIRQYSENQEKALFEKKISSAREFQEAATNRKEAEIALKAATYKLNALGIEPGKLTSMEGVQNVSGRFEVVSPIKGMVVDVSAITGELAVPERPIFSIAEINPIWLKIDVYEKDLEKIKAGQKTIFTLSDNPDRKFSGKVVAVGSEMDDTTRTAKVYAEINNPQRLLKANMFGRAQIQISEPEPKLTIPKAAVQSDGDCEFIFVMTANEIFKTRSITTGAIYEKDLEVLGGLVEGEKVVTDGGFLLRTEILRSQIGAGCCDD